MSLDIEITANPLPHEDDFVIENTRRYNSRFQENVYQHLSVYIRDENNNIVAGLTGKTYWGWLHVEYLWVNEHQRGEGLGSSLMLAAEKEAANRGCVGSMLDTFSFQAPEFYQKLGYQPFGVLHDYSGGHQRFYLQKALTDKHGEANCSLFSVASTEEVVELFTNVFSASENESEGRLIGRLVSDLIASTKFKDLIGCVATRSERIVGCLFLSRFLVPSGETAFILSPVAIATNEQGTGIGQQLITYGLNHLKSLGVGLVFTYGDPNYYCKTGFDQISERIVKAPFTLSQPQGWLAQSLDGKPIEAMLGATQCVTALSNQKYW